MPNNVGHSPRPTPPSSQVIRLQSQLDVQITRTSLLQKRLNDTLTTLDALTQSHAQELGAVKRSKQRLRSKLDEYIEYVKELEAHMDQLRTEAVGIVQEAVLSNGSISCTQIHLPHPLEPLPRPPPVHPSGSDSDYAKFTIQTLRAQVERERREHALEMDDAEREIISLRAQLARREAELESCIYHTGADRNVWHALPEEPPQPTSSLGASQDTHTAGDSFKRIPPSSLTREDMHQIFGIADARNRSLECDNRDLSDVIQKTKATYMKDRPQTSRPPSRGAASRGPLTASSPIPESPTTPRAGLPKRRRPIESSSCPPTPRIPRQPSPVALATRTRDEGPNPTSILDQFRSQLQRLEGAIDSFAAEKRDILRVFEEQTLRFSDRESLLSPSGSKVAAPLQSFDPPDWRPPTTNTRVLFETHSSTTTPRRSIEDILDETDSVQSMDLASPLQPTILFSDHSWAGSLLCRNEEDGLSRYHEPVDPSLVPLPDSPPGSENAGLIQSPKGGSTSEGFAHDDSGVLLQDSLIDLRSPPRPSGGIGQELLLPNRISRSIQVPSRTRTPSPRPAWLERASLIERLDHLERELRDAREELEMRKKELDQMKSVMDGLDVELSVRAADS